MADLPDTQVDWHLMGCQLLQHEGFVPHAYKDSLGYLTIGIGRMVDPRKGGQITKDEALYLLKNDMERHANELDQHIPWWRKLDGVRQRVLLDMAFNLGTTGLLRWKTFLGQVASRNYEAASRNMATTLWAKQVKGRAVRLTEMMRSGKEPSDLKPC